MGGARSPPSHQSRQQSARSKSGGKGVGSGGKNGPIDAQPTSARTSDESATRVRSTPGATRVRPSSALASLALAPSEPGGLLDHVAQRLPRGEAAAVVEQDLQAPIVEIRAES